MEYVWVQIEYTVYNDISGSRPDWGIILKLERVLYPHIVTFAQINMTLNNTRPAMAAVKANIKHIMNIEKYIAQTNNNMN
jgi:hypothetical protein